MGYYLPFSRAVKLGQTYGSNPGLGPNPPGGHNGDDWLTVIGTPVFAAGDGEVIFAGQFDDTYADNFGWNLNYGGNMVVLNMDGPAGPYFEYGHLLIVLVTAGQRVKAGDVIALTGNSDGGTGVSSGPHCHVGCLPPNFNLNTNTYGRVNPRIYMTDYWDGGIGTISAQSAIITPLEDELSAGDVAAIIDAVQKMHDVTREYIPGATLTRQVPHKHPVTGQNDGETTSLATMAGYFDFQHTATRQTVLAAVRGLVDTIVAGSPDAAKIAEEAYNKFSEKLGSINLTITAGGAK